MEMNCELCQQLFVPNVKKKKKVLAGNTIQTCDIGSVLHKRAPPPCNVNNLLVLLAAAMFGFFLCLKRTSDPSYTTAATSVRATLPVISFRNTKLEEHLDTIYNLYSQTEQTIIGIIHSSVNFFLINCVKKV